MAHKSQIRIACGDTIREGLAEGESLQTKAILKLKAKGVEFHRFPPKVLARLRKAWHEVAAKLSAKSRNFERIWSVLTRFREEHRVWRELGYLDE